MTMVCAGGPRRSERGLTLIEVLVAFFLLFVVSLAVLQLLSMAYMTNLSSSIRTELTYKAEQVVETIRLLNYRYYFLLQSPSTTEAACCPVAPGSTGTITPGTCMDFWGPNGADVIHDDSRFTLDYTISADNIVTVHAAPLQPNASKDEYLYLGPAASKVVVYVAHLRDWT